VLWNLFPYVTVSESALIVTTTGTFLRVNVRETVRVLGELVEPLRILPLSLFLDHTGH
jgi:hypothetical protein